VDAHMQKAAIAYKYNVSKTRSILKAALKLDKPSSFKIYHALGKLEQKASNSERAIEYFERCLELNPYYHYSMKALADTYADQNDLGMSIYFYQEYLQLDPYSCRILNRLGTILNRV
jgi:tetratricopeptide (TPR) repeat protein